MTMAKQAHPLGLYLHIPFCRSKCAYCDFYSLSGRRIAWTPTRRHWSAT